jgi:prepilin-type N-terminal cleavage/methylation domain-containing protein
MLVTFRTITGIIRRVHAGSQDGFTLIEALVVSAILPFVLFAVLGPLDFAQTQTPKNIEYVHAISDASTGLQQMMREIRQAYRIDLTTSSSIEFNAVINDRPVQIFYECDEPYPTNTGDKYAERYRRCLRVSAATGAALPSITTGAVIIDRVLNYHEGKPVFTFKDSSGKSDPTNPTYVEAEVRVPARGPLNSGLEHTIVLDNGTSLPNLALGS